MNNTCNIVNQEQAGLVRKKIKRFRKSNFLTDIEIICQDGPVYLHKVILCQMFPEISLLFCGNCDLHGDTVFILPEGRKDEIVKEVKNLYSFGISSGLKELLGFSGNKNIVQLKRESVEEESGKNEMYHENTNETSESLEFNEKEVKTMSSGDDDDMLELVKYEEGIQSCSMDTDEQINEIGKQIQTKAVKSKVTESKSDQVYLPAAYKEAKNGGRILICPDGFKYSKVKEQVKRAYYKCRNHKKDNCHVVTTVTKEDDMIVRMAGTHNHAAKSSNSDANEVVDTAVREAVTNLSLSPRKVAASILAQLDSMELSEKQSIIKPVSIVRRITRGRQKLLELTGLAVPKSWENL